MNEKQEIDEDEIDNFEYAIRPNKTRIKKEISELFKLGEELSTLSPAQLNSFELPETLRKALDEVSGMPHKGARKRLLKYIAAQLYKIDFEPILEQLARLKNQSAHSVREHHLAERWRDRLIQGGTNDLAELMAEWPRADSQRLRQLVRNAQKEAERLKPPKSARMLYRYLKELASDTASDNLQSEQEKVDE